MSKNTTEVSKCNKNDIGKAKPKSVSRRKRKSSIRKGVKTFVAFVFKRPFVLRFALVHLPDAAAAIEMWGKEAISFLRDIF